MNRFLLALLLMPITAFAQTGIYYDPMVNGEGITAFDDGERLSFYLYTYGAERCDLVEGATVSNTECETATVTVEATAECPLDKKGDTLCDPVIVTVTEDVEVCVSAEATSIEKECDLNGQRWFFAADDFDGKSATGLFYSAQGINFPKGVLNPEIWGGVHVGEVKVVGIYLMEWDGVGYTMTVVPFGDVDPTDPIYQQVYTFTTQLF